MPQVDGNDKVCVDNLLTHSIMESISDGVFTVDGDWRVTSFNRAAENITGVKRENAIGRSCWEVFRADACETSCPLRRTLESGKPIINRNAYIINAKGERIPVSISTAILKDHDGKIIGGAETFRDLSVEEELKQQLHNSRREIVSHSPAMRNVMGMLPDVAASDATVVIHGETGTGKELLARAIHNLSLRRNKPFVAVNCGALPDTLLESELFGYRKGAFTDAKADKPGRFALAEGGTIFLDEIGDLSPVLQVKLLRVLQEKAYEPLGATDSVTANVRVITATHRDLDAMVECEEFRRDLYYRINVVRLDLPPLRERPEDVPLLADHFIRHFNRLRGVKISGLNPKALTLMQQYTFPGNVRELENIVERAFVLCHRGVILPEHLPAGIQNNQLAGSHCQPSGILKESAKSAEADAIIAALEKHHFNRVAAAEELGIHKSTLHRKIGRLNIKLPSRDGRSARRD
ncbi:MAG: sigma 54-interacting transcriptional regulator [Planctomycetes bacterium]|nr:sigma 54-interacting transcriptional regulator [Planctomycetota bacterium]